MGTNDLPMLPYFSWRTLRAPTTTGDTLLTDYKPLDVATPPTGTQRWKTGVLTATGQLLCHVHPATVIGIRCFAKGVNNDTAAGVVFSGWMDPMNERGSGVGQRLWTGTLTLGAKSIAALIPNQDGKWASGTWLEIDTWTASADVVGARELNTTDQESMLVLPTLGYTHILAEVPAASLGGAGEVTEIGFLYRCLRAGDGTTLV